MSDGRNPWIVPGVIGALVIGVAALLLRVPTPPEEPTPPPKPKATRVAPPTPTATATEVVGPKPTSTLKPLPQLAGMIKALKEQREPRNRAYAAAYLGKHARHCGLEELQLLQTSLAEDAAPEVRAAAATALGRFGERAAPARRALETASKQDREVRVREAAQAALMAIEAARKTR